MLKIIKSFILVVLVIFGCLPVVGGGSVITTRAADEALTFDEANELVENYCNKADFIDFDGYLTDHFITSPVIDLIHNGMNDMTIAPGYIEDLQSNAVFNAAYTVWEGKNLILNPGDTAQKLLNRELYYETVLFRLLDSFVTENTTIDWFNKEVISNCLEFAQSLSDADTIDYAFDFSNRTPITEMSASKLERINSRAKNYLESKGSYIIGEDLTFVDSILDASATVEEFIERLCSYAGVANLSDSIRGLLEKMKENSSNSLLNTAIDTVLAVSGDAFITLLETAVSKTAVTITGTSLQVYFANNWKSIILEKLNLGVLSSGFTVVNAVWLGAAVGQSISNICFSTDKRIDHYELMRALVETEYVVTDTVSELLEGKESGKLISTGLDLLYKVYEMDCDLCIDLVEISEDDWIKLSSSSEREQIKADIKTVKKYFSTQYNNVVPDKGECGSDLYWLYDKYTKDLYIYGVGQMNDFGATEAPWYEYRDSIYNIYVSSQCTKIGKYAFYNLSELSSPIVFTKGIAFNENCFFSMGNDVSLIFCETADISGGTVNVGSVYAFEALTFEGNSMSMRNLYIAQELYLKNNSSLYILEDGTMSVGSYTSEKGCYLQFDENVTACVYGDVVVCGKSCDVYSFKIEDGAELNIYGNALFYSGKCSVSEKATVSIFGNCKITCYFFIYGKVTVAGKMDVHYDNISTLLRIYGTIVMGDFEVTQTTTDDSAIVCLDGTAYITDETVTHDLSFLLMYGENAYLSVKGNAENIYWGYDDGSIAAKGEGGYESIYENMWSGVIELYGNAHFSYSRLKNKTIILSGDEEQIIDGALEVSQILIENKKGVIFEDFISVYGLFLHGGNPFTLNNGGYFQDYDNDGLKDEADPHPTVWSDWDYKVSDSEITITGYRGSEVTKVIPAVISGCKVTGVSAKFDDTNLENITIGKNVTHISGTSFNSAENLENIYVDTANENFLSENGILYTADKSILVKYPRAKSAESYTVNDTTEDIETYAFYCADVKEVILPETLKDIGAYAFMSSKINSMRIPPNVTTVGLKAFSSCSNLKTVHFDAKKCSAPLINPLGSFTFPSNVEEVIIGDEVQKIPNYFIKAGRFTEIIIPPSVVSIADKAFQNFSDLTIKAYNNSCAKDYAVNKGYKFVALSCGNCRCSDLQTVIEASCTKDGLKTGVCDICAADVTVTEPAGHTDIKLINVVESTCIKEGYSGDTYCNICKTVIEKGISIAKKAHIYSSVVITPTCTTEGYTTYFCDCGDTRTDNIVSATGHEYGKDGICISCSEYNESYDENIKAADCTCNCHKTGFMRAIWRIVRFLCKLFKVNSVCSCGMAHY